MTMIRTMIRYALGLAGVALVAGEALAQEYERPGCGVYGSADAVSEEYVFEATAGCARAMINRQLMVNNIDVLSRVVAFSFGIGPGRVEPAGLANLSPAEFGGRLEDATALVITPTGDEAAAAAPASRWNLWGDGKYTWNDNSPSNFDLDGPLWNGLAGVDYKLTDKMTIGLMASYESSDLDGIGTDLQSTGLGGGPYIGIVLTDNVVFSANVTGSRLDSSQLGGLLDFESGRLQAAAALNGYWFRDTWRFTPGLSLSWSKEWMEETSGFLLPDQTIETAMLTPSVQIGNTLRLSDTGTVEPWAGAALDYVFVNTTATDGFGSVKDPYADLRLQLGLNFGFGGNAQLAITGELGGLLMDASDTYAIEANLAVQF